LALNRLDRHERIILVAQIASGKALPDEVVAQIIDRTDGVPLFVEELTKERLGERSAARGTGSLRTRPRIAAIRDPDDLGEPQTLAVPSRAPAKVDVSPPLRYFRRVIDGNWLTIRLRNTRVSVFPVQVRTDGRIWWTTHG
jgi:hypothetical protein